MACYKPIQAFRTATGVTFVEDKDAISRIEIPCGMCVGCRIRRAEDWTIRCMHEASLHEQNCFVTLTYGRDKLPANASLEHRDFQLFLKAVRHHLGPVRYYMCGEYGPLNGRPHFHACLFGQGFRAGRTPAGRSKGGHVFYRSAELTELWGHGLASVQDLTRETASYCAQYIMTKKLGPDAGKDFDFVDADGVLQYKTPEYNRMSLKPGIGAAWLEKYKEDIYRHDYAIQDGQERRPPKYYDKLMRRQTDEAERMEAIAYQRELRGRAAHADNTDERRRVRQQVAEAKVRASVRRDI